MSLASWPPTGYKLPKPEDHPHAPVNGETPDEVFEAVLKQYIHQLPAIYGIRKRTTHAWIKRYNQAKKNV